MKATNPILWLGVVIAVGVAAVAYNTWSKSQMVTTADGIRVPAATTEQLRAVERIKKRWSDSAALAASTSRMSLPSLIADMQAQRRELDDADVGACLTSANQMLAAAMDETISLYLAFLGSDSERDQQLAMAERAGAAEAAITQFRKRKDACVP